MSNVGRAQTGRPDSRTSTYAGRFTNALSMAISKPPPPSIPSTEEQLEEVEQKITLTLQAIDANFDHCQRTMARDVMPKIEHLGKLSSSLLQASQPWLQFFMAVAAADDGSESVQENKSALSEEQIRVVDEQEAEITARFPQPVDTVDDADDTVDIDAEIATPQLTSRFMTQEQPRAHETPRGYKRMAEQLSASVRKRPKGTPNRVARTPVSMMRALVGTRPIHGSGVSMVSKNSSMGTSDLMPDTSPPHTTTFALPKSRVAGNAQRVEEEDFDDDDILGEIDGLIRRYDSPSKARSGRGAASVRSQGSARSQMSVGSQLSVGSKMSVGSTGEMTQLADKYSSPGLLPTFSVPGTQDVQRVRGL
ncbi:hypothetical protein EV176_003224, partial [Coemansia sp. RSA 451]